MAARRALSAPTAAAEDQPAYGPELQGFDYPWPVSYFSFTSQGEALRMAYMDVKPTAPANGQTVVLFHGKNFCAATWQDTIAVLSEAGYRVIAVDQIGFCKSSKPAHYQFSFQQLSGNTHALLASLGISRATIIGHSVGGMLGMRYALTFPDDVDLLVLVNPIGLEDWKAKGVPWQSIDAWYQQELKTTADSIRGYQRSTYYAGTWDAKYERWVQMLAGLYRGPGHDIVSWNMALVDDMAYTQPVFYEFEQHIRAGAAADRRQGHHGLGQESGGAGAPRRARRLCGAGESGGRPPAAGAPGRVSRFRPRAANPGARRIPQGSARQSAGITQAGHDQTARQGRLAAIESPALPRTRPDRAGDVGVRRNPQHHDHGLAHGDGIHAVTGRMCDRREKSQLRARARQQRMRDQPPCRPRR